MRDPTSNPESYGKKNHQNGFYATAYVIFLISLIIDIGGALKIKYASSIYCAFLCLHIFTTRGVKSKYILEYSLALIIFLVAIYSVSLGAPLEDILAGTSFAATLLVLPVVDKVSSQSIERIFVYAVLFCSLLIIATFIFILFRSDLANQIRDIGATLRLGYLGINPSYNFNIPNVYFRWSILLVAGFILSIGKRNLIALIVFIASILTLSTAIIIGVGVYAALYFLANIKLKNIKVKKRDFFLILVMSSFFLATSTFFGKNYSAEAASIGHELIKKTTTSSDSTKTKIGHIDGIIRAIREFKTGEVFLGSGIGSKFYSPSTGSYITNVEVSHFNALRQFGVVGSLSLLLYIFYISMQSYKCGNTGKRWALAIAVLFIISGTNPLLLSPVFFTLLVSARAYAISHLQETSSK